MVEGTPLLRVQAGNRLEGSNPFVSASKPLLLMDISAPCEVLRTSPGFRQMQRLQMFAAIHLSVHNHLNQSRALSRPDHFKTDRAATLAERWVFLAA